ncbi:MAG: hypothetical protein LBI03_00730 [Clostridiales bacterium]|jgi:hypothetical protein|nr:hypothetical protein [Clostridiales bacterium]
MNILDIVADAWREGKLPVINGLIKIDGSFFAVQVEDCPAIVVNYTPLAFDVNNEDYIKQFLVFLHAYYAEQMVNICFNSDDLSHLFERRGIRSNRIFSLLIMPAIPLSV